MAMESRVAKLRLESITKRSNLLLSSFVSKFQLKTDAIAFPEASSEKIAENR